MEFFSHVEDIGEKIWTAPFRISGMFIEQLFDRRTAYTHYALRHSFRQGKRVRKINIVSLAKWLIDDVNELNYLLKRRRELDPKCPWLSPDQYQSLADSTNQGIISFILTTQEKTCSSGAAYIAALKQRLEGCLAFPAWKVGMSRKLLKRGILNPAALLKMLPRSRNQIPEPIDLSLYQRNDIYNYDDSEIDSDEDLPLPAKPHPWWLDDDSYTRSLDGW